MQQEVCGAWRYASLASGDILERRKWPHMMAFELSLAKRDRERGVTVAAGPRRGDESSALGVSHRSLSAKAAHGDR
jgi:hypothetical protein